MTKFLKNIIGFSLKNKYFILFTAALLIMAGAITFHQIPIEAFPDGEDTGVEICCILKQNIVLL